MQKEMKKLKTILAYIYYILFGFFLWNTYELYFLRYKYLENKYFLFRFMYLIYNLFISILKKLLTYTYLLYIHLPLIQKALKTKLTWNTCNLSSLCYLFTSWTWVDIFSFNFWQISFNYPTQLANSIWVFLASCLVFTKNNPSITPPM